MQPLPTPPILHESYTKTIFKQFVNRRLGLGAFIVILIFLVVGIYAPFLASSKPFIVYYDQEWYFPLFRYLFYTGFFTKRLDIFFNLLIFTFPLFLLALFGLKHSLRRWACGGVILLQFALFLYLAFRTPVDPASNPELNRSYQQAIQEQIKSKNYFPNWEFELKYMTFYAKLNMLLRYQQQKWQHERLKKYASSYIQSIKNKWLPGAIRQKKAELLSTGIPADKIPSDSTLEELVLKTTPKNILERKLALPTLWQIRRDNEQDEIERQKQVIADNASQPDSQAFRHAQATIQYLKDRQNWLEEQSGNLKYEVMPLIRPYHWEDDAGGEQSLNQYIPWWELTRINRKDLVAALIFGIRISLTVGITAVGLSVLIGVPIGAFAGFYGGTTDIIVSRLLEIWEAMPTFFMLLMVVAVMQSKSIFLVIAVIGLFGWTSFSRYIRGEFFKQRNLPYVDACRALGFSDGYMMFSHILPNAIPPLLTLLPFGIMAAITSEAALSFLGLGEEGSCSWGVLMDEGRSAFPSESYLLWPPAILLTILLVSIALVGDALRDSLDPKMHRITE